MNEEQWRHRVDRDAARLKTAEREGRSLLAQTVFLGTLSAIFLLPLSARSNSATRYPTAPQSCVQDALIAVRSMP